MAIKQPKPQPGYQLRHRLTGAVIIVTFAVVIIPFLLHSPTPERLPAPEQGGQVDDDSDPITVPDGLTESEVPDSPDEPLIIEPDETQPQPEERVDPAPVAAVSPGDQTDRQDKQDSDQPEPEDDHTERQTVVTADPVQQTGQVLFVRVGTYVNIKNVNAISKLLTDNGFEARHTEVQTTHAKAVRVWLGPYYDPEKAEQARLQARALTHEKVYVTEQAP